MKYQNETECDEFVSQLSEENASEILVDVVDEKNSFKNRLFCTQQRSINENKQPYYGKPTFSLYV